MIRSRSQLDLSLIYGKRFRSSRPPWHSLLSRRLITTSLSNPQPPHVKCIHVRARRWQLSKQSEQGSREADACVVLTSTNTNCHRRRPPNESIELQKVFLPAPVCARTPYGRQSCLRCRHARDGLENPRKTTKITEIVSFYFFLFKSFIFTWCFSMVVTGWECVVHHYCIDV